MNHKSASSPVWCEACPVSIGPPRGCEISPTIKPFQPSRLAFRESSSSVLISTGWPQRRLRDKRMTCQYSPSTGIATPPAMQPLE